MLEVLSANWQLLFLNVGLFTVCTLGFAVIAKIFGCGVRAGKYLERKWISHIFAYNILIYIMVKDGIYLQTAGGIALIIIMGTVVLAWNIFEHIGDNHNASIELEMGGGKKIKIGNKKIQDRRKRNANIVHPDRRKVTA